MYGPARIIDHDAPITAAVAPAVSAEYGEYLVSIAYCVHCHGDNLTGGPFPFPEPNAPLVPNITSAGAPGGWSEAQFRETLRTGVTPGGKVLDPEFMPWSDYKMTDEELGGHAAGLFSMYCLARFNSSSLRMTRS